MKEFPQFDLSSTINSASSIQNQIEEANRRRIREIEQMQQQRRNEKLREEKEANRKHEELIAALKESGDKIIVGDNANGVQIQHNSSGASQTMNYIQEFDYEKARAILLEIKEYTEFSKFSDTFGSNSDNVKAIIDSTIEAINNKDDEGIIKKSLRVLKDLAVGAGSSLIASGIIALLETLPL